MPQTPLDYRSAGVDITAGERLVERIKPLARATRRAGVLGGLGGFGGLFELSGYRQPVLVAGTDGVGTKLKLGLAAGRHRGLGIDLVAMCVNDVIVCGAEPLFFLDYYATSKLDIGVAEEVIAGIADGCRLAGMALLGGETAEMPGLYAAGDYDLAGFCVGVVEKARLDDTPAPAAGDPIIALASSGPHANGFSLIRKLLERSGADLTQPCGDVALGDALLEPTRIYAPALRQLHSDAVCQPRAVAHITGGGITDNLPRVLAHGLGAEIDAASWRRPVVFDWLQQTGAIDDAEMWRTFNCGVGLLLCVAPQDLDPALDALRGAGETAWRAGTVVNAVPDQPRVVYRNRGAP